MCVNIENDSITNNEKDYILGVKIDSILSFKNDQTNLCKKRRQKEIIKNISSKNMAYCTTKYEKLQKFCGVSKTQIKPWYPCRLY